MKIGDVIEIGGTEWVVKRTYADGAPCSLRSIGFVASPVVGTVLTKLSSKVMSRKFNCDEDWTEINLYSSIGAK